MHGLSTASQVRPVEWDRMNGQGTAYEADLDVGRRVTTPRTARPFSLVPCRWCSTGTIGNGRALWAISNGRHASRAATIGPQAISVNRGRRVSMAYIQSSKSAARQLYLGAPQMRS